MAIADEPVPPETVLHVGIQATLSWRDNATHSGTGAATSPGRTSGHGAIEVP